MPFLSFSCRHGYLCDGPLAYDGASSRHPRHCLGVSQPSGCARFGAVPSKCVYSLYYHRGHMSALSQSEFLGGRSPSPSSVIDSECDFLSGRPALLLFLIYCYHCCCFHYYPNSIPLSGIINIVINIASGQVGSGLESGFN